ncbi:hypothetical protein HYG89_11700 [Acinetobacter sp. SwsAc5]|uniref:hypothetical protein n=1 Tax=Acinetobacter sp. SwsAc5 TaxID=2749438 RepID=UPI0015BC844C|nr:hypothetical protein [Acinetobacter sp. SwsAc5]NWK53197.1 hypothetical protein [Acinetobacter sp. SwsAc5]
MPRLKNKGTGNFENWSNFLTKGSRNEYAARCSVFESLQNVKFPDSSRSVWREYVGEVMIALMDETDPKELSELLVLNGYLDLKGFIKTAAALGMERDAAVAKYESLMLELRK